MKRSSAGRGTALPIPLGSSFTSRHPACDPTAGRRALKNASRFSAPKAAPLSDPCPSPASQLFEPFRERKAPHRPSSTAPCAARLGRAVSGDWNGQERLAAGAAGTFGRGGVSSRTSQRGPGTRKRSGPAAWRRLSLPLAAAATEELRAAFLPSPPPRHLPAFRMWRTRAAAAW